VYQIKVFATPYEVAEHVAEWFVTAATEAIRHRNRFLVAVAGGSTPRLLYEEIAQRYSTELEWEKVFLFWGDERYVPPDHADSNYRMVKETLLVHVPIPFNNVVPMPTEGDPEMAAEQYERTLQGFMGEHPTATFDFVLLGMGDDGHTASLFPYTDAIHEQQKWVVAHKVDKTKGWRLTLTPPILNLARQTVIMVTGKSKSERLSEVLNGPFDPQRLPIQTIIPVHNHLTWAIDRAAYSFVRQG
jgi:6-phosphogluconolactonase